MSRLIYEKTLIENENQIRKLFYSEENVPTENDVEITYKNEEQETVNPTRETFIYGTEKLLHYNDTLNKISSNEDQELALYAGDKLILGNDSGGEDIDWISSDYLRAAGYRYEEVLDGNKYEEVLDGNRFYIVKGYPQSTLDEDGHVIVNLFADDFSSSDGLSINAEFKEQFRLSFDVNKPMIWVSSALTYNMIDYSNSEPPFGYKDELDIYTASEDTTNGNWCNLIKLENNINILIPIQSSMEAIYDFTITGFKYNTVPRGYSGNQFDKLVDLTELTYCEYESQKIDNTISVEFNFQPNHTYLCTTMYVAS